MADFVLDVPLDASRIEGAGDQPLKVVGRAKDGSVVSTLVVLGADGRGSATLRFDTAPGAVQVAVGPQDATDEELLAAETIGARIPTVAWGRQKRLKIAPLDISSWHWGRWLRWCRTVTVRGRLVCPDGRPVPGATVCAYDVDWWFIWSSTQQVGCATTALDGTFEIKFRWCCGVYPWWWWFQQRGWQFNSVLSDQVAAALAQVPDLPIAPPTAHPSLAPFARLLGRDAVPLQKLEPKDLDAVRESLLPQLPAAPELERLQVWPWAPWTPWRDCNPDLIFRATQNCRGRTAVVLDETVKDTRWNTADVVDVTLVANEQACCLPDCGDGPCESDCLVVSEICGNPIDQIGGNLGAPVGPDGYLLPGDNPFAGIVAVDKNPGDLLGVDYYAVEHSVDGGASWNPLPAGASVPFKRQTIRPIAVIEDQDFTTTPFSGYELYETREHFEATHYGDWFPGPGQRQWLSTNYSLLIPIDTTTLADGLHDFRVLGFTDAGGGVFKGGEPVPVCAGEGAASFRIQVDNRVVTPFGHPMAHNCGAGVHTCTTEPDTHILEVRINGVPVGPCDTVNAREGTLEIDFLVTDPDQHLGWYSLTSHYGNSSVVDLVAAGSLSGGGGIVGPTYAQALTQGAVRPFWAGGTYTLKVDVATAFPIPCCYLLRLEAGKRTLVGGGGPYGFSCGGDFRNASEITLGVGVC